MKNLILKQVNAIGTELGFPFYVYPDGTCGKSMVSGGLNAVMVVKKKFPVEELKSDFLTGSQGSDENVLAHLTEIGNQLGFPLYVYADGMCGLTPSSEINKFPFTMMVKKPFVVNQMVVEPNDVAVSSDSSTVKKITSYPCSTWTLPAPQVFTPTDEEVKILEKAREKVRREEVLSRDEERVYLCFATDTEFENFVLNRILFCSNEKYILLRGTQDLVKKYVLKHCWDDVVVDLMAERCSDDVILAYFSKWLVRVKVVEKLLELGRFELIEKIQEVSSLDARRLCSDRHVAAIIKAGHSELLKTQIRKHGFRYEDDVEALIKTGNVEMIKYYLDYHSLSESAQKELIELGNAQLVKIYQERYGFCSDSLKLAKWRGLLCA